MKLGPLLQQYRQHIIQEWLHRLQTEVSPLYSARPTEELILTVTEALDANCAALLENDFSRLDEVITHIGRLRGNAGFRLSEVQAAFELFRAIIVPVLVKEIKGRSLFSIIEHLNDCLAYTIHKFSDQFQELHEKEIKQYAQDLEITVDKRTKELSESERKYRRLVEEIRDGYFVHKQRTIVFANQAFCDMHGYALNEVIGKDFSEFIAQESLQEVERLYRERMASNRSEGQYVYLRLNKDGEAFPTENKVVLTEYEGDAAVIGICRDITERTEIEQRLREAERLAHIGQLTTSIAHEIRNPLSSASMSIQDLLKNLSVSGNNKRRIEILGDELARVDRIVTEMLEFAKPVRFEFNPASVEPLIDSCLDVLEAKIRQKNIAVRRVIPENLPELLLDWEKMVQAIINILLNSIEAVGTGGQVEISAMKSGQVVRVEIRDNGPGIAKGDLAYVFDPFFSRKTKGTGLGLANAKKVIESHGGTLEIQCTSGGTGVIIKIPVQSPDLVLRK